MGFASYLGINYFGAIQFRDMHIPKPNKDEWGIDTLTRTMRGPLSLFEEWYAKFKQGQQYGEFYLQSFNPIDHPVFPGATLYYKGLIGGIIPDPKTVTDIGQLTATRSTSSPEKATRDIQYYSPQTTWRYITKAKPVGPKYNKVDTQFQVLVSSSVITREDGTRVTSADAGLVTALFATAKATVLGHSAEQIIGTPYYECTDSVAMVIPSN